MLIDIEKYVRQLLPPNRRLPKHIGLCTALFSPIEAVINSFNDFVYDSQFDSGTPGQAAVMEYMLQSYVNANIKVLGADGVRVDFRLLIPASLSTFERSQVVRMVERYRLRSKRYEVSESVDWGNGGGPIFGIAWLVAPFIIESDGKWNASFGVTIAGVYHTLIVNTTTGTVVYDDVMEFNGTSPFLMSVPEAGIYRVTVGKLSATMQAFTSNLVTVKPAWLTKFGITTDVNSRDLSAWLEGTSALELRVESPNGGLVRGAGWDSNSYLPGTTEFVVEPYDRVYRLNPVSFGVEGLVPGQNYRFFIRRVSDPSVIFIKEITIPVNSKNHPPFVIELGEAVDPGGPVSCDMGPNITSIVSSSSTGIKWSQDASGVTRVVWEILQGFTVVRNGYVDIVNSGGNAVFSPSNQPEITFLALAEGAYTLRIQGGNCASVPSARTFTVGVVTEPVIGDITPKIYAQGWEEHCQVQATGSSLKWFLKDFGTSPLPDNHVWQYQIGGHVFRQNVRIDKYPYQSDNEVQILLTPVKIGAGTLTLWGGQDWQDPNLSAGFSMNNSMGYTFILFNKLV